MRVTINAIPIQPGGGLTVVRGLLSSLRALEPDWHISVLTSSDATHQTISSDGDANDIEQIHAARKSIAALLWQNMRLGRKLVDIRSDAVVTVNHYLANIGVPQVVYHLNLRRFCKSFRSHRPANLLQERLRDWMARRALTKADANVFESQFLREAAEQASGRKVVNAHVAYIGLPMQLLSLPRREPARSSASRRIVSVTSAEPHKDNPTLLRAFAELYRTKPDCDWRLDIAGGIDADAWLPYQKLAERLGIRRQVTWHGFCNSETLTELMNDALCVVLTSQLESFAMVALEAMARGCPVVVANGTSMPESVGHAGIIATAGDPRSFASAVCRLAEDPTYRRQAIMSGYSWIQPFRWEQCGRRFREIIRQVTDKRAENSIERRSNHAA